MGGFRHACDKKYVEGHRKQYLLDFLQSGEFGMASYFYSGPSKSSYACQYNRTCKHIPYYHCTYHYVTGKAGRVSYASKYFCKEHGELFCTKNKIEVNND